MAKKAVGKSEKAEDLNNRIQNIIGILEKEYPNAKTALNFSNPLELLVAVMLSAQCTDVMVNKVTAELFKKYRTAEDYAKAPLEELEEDIRKTGFYHQKAKNLKGSTNMIIDDFEGEMPGTMDELLRLPGVARKTANIVLYNAFGIQEGIAVDTHVRRLSQRIGFSKNKDPNKIEEDLMKLVPKIKWGPFSYLLIEHGRAVCTGRKAKCEECVIHALCPKIEVEKRKDKGKVKKKAKR